MLVCYTWSVCLCSCAWVHWYVSVTAWQRELAAGLCLAVWWLWGAAHARGEGREEEKVGEGDS